MTKLNKFSKGMLLAASLTFVSLSVSANTTPSVNQVNTDLVSALERALSHQVSMIGDEINRNISVAIDQGLTELGLENIGGDDAKQVVVTNNKLLVKKDEE